MCRISGATAHLEVASQRSWMENGAQPNSRIDSVEAYSVELKRLVQRCSGVLATRFHALKVEKSVFPAATTEQHREMTSGPC